MRFWEETITTTPSYVGTDLESNELNANELELEEICILFKHWTNNVKSINEGLVIELIQHFYSDVVIENNKYILHTRCKLWNKYEEVVNAINQFKFNNVEEDIYNPYLFYCQKNKNKYNLLASKQYFEKNVTDIILNELELLGFP